MAKVLGCDIVISEFELQSRIDFRIYTMGKGMKFFYHPPQAVGQIVPHYKDGFGIK